MAEEGTAELASNLLGELLAVREGLRMRELTEAEAKHRIDNIRKRRLFRSKVQPKLVFRVYDTAGKHVDTFTEKEEHHAYLLQRRYHYRVEMVEVAA